MQLLCAENDTAMSMEKPTSNPSCAMYSHVPNESQSASVGPIDASTKSNGQPYYLCTVTCCDSANCTKPSTTNLISKAIVTKTDACLYSRFSTQTSTGRSICPVSPLNPSNCPACIKTRQARPRLVLLTNPTSDYSEDEYLSPSIKAVQESIGSSNQNANKSELSSSPLLSKGFQQQAKDSATRRSPKPQLSSERGREVHSPELSSSPPILGNSSFTDYTEPYTPVCTSVNSNPPDSVNHFKFGVSRKASPLNSEYSFYFSNVENHGFFRKAVPALPISMAVLFCLCNLVIPGSGTLFASLSIILGSQTEYGPGYGLRSFCICFLSACLQFSTAIFVFGWVWSIMWGIVFIKNSLRYGEKRDIHTISLC